MTDTEKEVSKIVKNAVVPSTEPSSKQVTPAQTDNKVISTEMSDVGNSKQVMSLDNTDETEKAVQRRKRKEKAIERQKRTFDLMSPERQEYVKAKYEQHRDTLEKVKDGDLLIDEYGQIVAEASVDNELGIMLVGENLIEQIPVGHFEGDSYYFLEDGGKFVSKEEYDKMNLSTTQSKNLSAAEEKVAIGKTTPTDGVLEYAQTETQAPETDYKHLYDEEKVSKEYINSVNPEIEDAIIGIRTGNTENIPEVINVTKLEKKTINAISNFVGFDVSGYACKIERDRLVHIENRHGITGKHDQSLSDPKDTARIGYAINNIDNIKWAVDENGNKVYDSKYNDRNNKTARVFVTETRIDGTYTINQVVPDSKKKTLWITSARIEKAGVGSQVPNTDNSPQLTSETPLDSSPASNDNISQDVRSVNNNYMQDRENDTQGTETYNDDLGRMLNDTRAELMGEDAGESEKGFNDVVKDSFGIDKLGDYIHVQKRVLQTLLDEKFFTDEENRRRIDVNKSSGMVIETNKSGIDETFNFKNYACIGTNKKIIKLATIRRLPEIIRDGVVVEDNVPNQYGDGNNKKFAYIEHTVEVGGNEVTIRLDIKKSPQKNKFYVHRIWQKDNASNFPASTTVGTEAGHTKADINHTLSHPDDDVKEENSAPTKHSRMTGTRDTSAASEQQSNVIDSNSKVNNYLRRARMMFVNDVEELMNIPKVLKNNDLKQVFNQLWNKYKESGKIAPESFNKVFDMLYENGKAISTEFYEQ